MRILQFIPELELAGAEVMVQHLSIKLREQGHDVKVVSLYDFQSPITERLEQSGVEVVYMDKSSGFDYRMFIRIFKFIQTFKPDVVHTHRYILPYVMPVAMLAGVKCRVHTVHNIASKEVSSSMQKINKVFYHLLGVIPVSISPLVRESIIKRYSLKAAKIPMIFNGVPIERFRKNAERSYRIYDESPKILHIGRFSQQKNHSMMIEAFSEVLKTYPDAELQLIGAGELVHKVEEQIRKLNLEDNVRLLGLHSDITGYMKAADVFILPSIYEGMPITLIEAMSSGLPIIASRVGGVPDMIEHGVSGMLCDVNTDSLISLLLEVLESEGLRARLGSGAADKAGAFSDEIMAEGYIHAYSRK